MNRRAFALSAAWALLAPEAAVAQSAGKQVAQLAALERRAGGRLGVYVLDTGGGPTIAYRASERFPMCSTFKLLAVAHVLARVQAGQERLDRRIHYSRADLLAYAPIARAHVHEGALSVASLCAAAIEWSDNTAANLLLRSFGGPSEVTAFARALGDRVTRLDRNEPSLNTAIPGDPRDTTSPFAMAHDARALVLGNVLKPQLRGYLRRWLLNCRTGSTRLHAGLPQSWLEGDKTGNGDHGTTNDVALVLPPHQKPRVIAAYYTGSPGNGDAQDAVLAAVGRIVSA